MIYFDTKTFFWSQILSLSNKSRSLSVEEGLLLEGEDDVSHPGPILLAVDNLGVEVAVPGDALPLCAGLQAMHIFQELLLKHLVLLLLKSNLFIILLVP